MTPDEATDRMKAISQFPTARGHMEADAILVQIAEEAGFRGQSMLTTRSECGTSDGTDQR